MKSVIVIGCVSCSHKHKQIDHPRFPAETGYTKDQMGDLIEGYTCPFCNGKYFPTPKMMRMIQHFMDGISHIRTLPDHVDVNGLDVNFGYDLRLPVDSERHFPGIEGMEEKLFQNDVEFERTLLLSALQYFDTHKWHLRIEVADNPVPLVCDDSLFVFLKK